MTTPASFYLLYNIPRHQQPHTHLLLFSLAHLPLGSLDVKLASLLLDLDPCSPFLVSISGSGSTLSSFSDRHGSLPRLSLSTCSVPAAGPSGCCSVYSPYFPLKDLVTSWLWMDSQLYFLHLNILITFFASSYCRSCRIYWVPSPCCSLPRHSFPIQSLILSAKKKSCKIQKSIKRKAKLPRKKSC